MFKSRVLQKWVGGAEALQVCSLLFNLSNHRLLILEFLVLNQHLLNFTDCLPGIESLKYNGCLYNVYCYCISRLIFTKRTFGQVEEQLRIVLHP